MANRYWVGGTGTWNTTSTTNWSASSGGASGASVPTAADSVFFDQNTTYTVTMTGALNCLDITVSSGTVTFATGTSPSLSVAGNFSINNTTVWNSTGAITFTATTAKTITTNGRTINGNMVFNGVAGTWQMLDALTTGSTNTVTLTNGTLNLNNFTLTTGQFLSTNANTRTIAFGTGKIVGIGSSTAAISMATSTNLTITGTPIFEVTNATSTGANFGGSAAGYWTESTDLNVKIGSSSGTAGLYVTNTASLTLTGVYADFDLTGFTGALQSSARTIYGNFIFPSGATSQAVAAVTTFAATSGTKTINTNGVTVTISCTFNGAGGTWQLLGNANFGSGTTVTLTAGTLDLNGYYLTTGSLFTSTGSGVRSIAFGTTGQMRTGSGVNMALSTNFTLTGTPIFTSTNAASTNFQIGSTTAGYWTESTAISFYIGSPVAGQAGFYATNTASLGLEGTYKDVNTTGLTGSIINSGNRTIYGNLTLGSGSSITASSTTWTFAATSGTKTITTNGVLFNAVPIFDGVGGTWQLQDALTVGPLRTTTLTNGTLDLNGQTLSTGIFSSSGATTRSVTSSTPVTMFMTYATTATVFNTGIVTGLTTSGNITVDITGNNAVTKSISQGIPSAANAFSFTVGGNGTTITFSSGNIKDLTITNTTCTITNVALNIYGNLLAQGTSPTITGGANTWTFAGSGSKTITTNGEAFPIPLTFNGAGGTWTLQDDFIQDDTFGRIVTHTNGTIDLNGKTFTTGRYATAAGTKSIVFNGGTLGCVRGLGASGVTVFDNAAPTGFTTVEGSAEGTIYIPGSGTTTFAGGGSTFNCRLLNDTQYNIPFGGTDALIITGSNTFKKIESNSVAAYPTGTGRRFIFTAGTTTTILNDFIANGESGKEIYIQSSTGGSPATLTKSSGTVSVSYCVISDSTATGGASWQAYTTNGNTNGGNNTGWIFISAFSIDSNVVLGIGILFSF